MADWADELAAKLGTPFHNDAGTPIGVKASLRQAAEILRSNCVPRDVAMGLREAVRAIEEGGLGDEPWFANYDRIREFARENGHAFDAATGGQMTEPLKPAKTIATGGTSDQNAKSDLVSEIRSGPQMGCGGESCWRDRARTAADRIAELEARAAAPA